MNGQSVAFALCAAVIGAGFASGQEIMRFFAQYGNWGIAGAVLAACLMALIALKIMNLSHAYDADSLPLLCSRAISPIAGHICHALFAALLVISGGAMCAASGELFALTMPFHGAYLIGFLFTLLVSHFLSLRSVRILGYIGQLIAPLMAAFYLLLLSRTPRVSVSIALPVKGFPDAFVMAALYAPLNMILSGGILCEAGGKLGTAARKKTSGIFLALMLLLLLLSTSVLVKNAPILSFSALPMVALSARLGLLGFFMSALLLYAAVLSTLIAILRALFCLPHTQNKRAHQALSSLACALCGAIGFEKLVGGVYPALGIGCAVLLVSLLPRRAPTA